MRYAFSDCVLDTERCALTRAGEPVGIRPKVFKVLTYLIENHDRVVSKQELFDRLWHGRIVGDATLNSCLKEARQAVGDSGAEQRIIKTLHGQGYHFIASIRLEQLGHEAAGSEPAANEVAVEPAAAPELVLADREHKQVSVLACAIVDLDDLALDAEAMDELIRRFFAAANDTLSRYGGVMAERAGDGFTALFGAPQALEDHARRAALAAIEIARFGREPVVPGGTERLKLNCGLHTGSAVVGSTAEDDPLYSAAGPTTRTACRLRDQARGQVLASASLLELIEPESEARPQRLADGTIAFRIRGLSGMRAGVPRRRSGRSAFVGRDGEIAIIRQRLALAEGGTGQTVCISGEPGIGKSRLVSEVRAALDGPACLQANCLGYRVTSPYFPLQQLLRTLVGDESSDAGIAARLARRAADAGVADAGVIELLAALLNAAAADQTDQNTPPAGQEALVRAVTRLLLQPSESRPLVIVVEDLHWIDPSSEEWLASFVPRIAGSRVLLLVTYRPGYRSRWLTHSSVTQLALPRLNDADSAALIGSLPAPLADSTEIRQRIVSHAQGNPFFLEELTYNLADGAGSERRTVPTTVQAVLSSRIDQLGPTDKSLLQLAAVIGTPVMHDLLAAVFDRDPVTIEHAIERLEAAELLFEQRAGQACNYHFKHALTEEVAYRSLIASARRACHRRIARVYENRFPDQAANHPEVVAHHLSEADAPDKAMAYWTAAGIRAAQRSANPEAVLHFERALEASERLPPSPELETRQLEVYLRLGCPLMSSKAFTAPSVEQAYLKAKRLCHTVGTREQLFTVLWGLWLHHSHRGHLSEARTLATQILELADGLEDPAFRLQAHHSGWTNELWHGDLEDCESHATAGLELYDPDTHQAHRYLYGGHDPGVCACGSAGLAAWFLGYADRSRRLTRRGADLAWRLDHPFSKVIASIDLMDLGSFCREPAVTLENARMSIELCTDLKVPNYLAVGRIHAGWATAMRGDREEGRKLLIRGLDQYAAAGAERKQAHYLLLLAEVCASKKHSGRGLEALDRAQESIDRTGEIRWAPEILRLKGELKLIRTDDQAAARDLFERARVLAAEQRCKSYELRSAISLAALLKRQGDSLAASEVLRPIYEWFSEGFETGDLRAARQLLDGLT